MEASSLRVSANISRNIALILKWVSFLLVLAIGLPILTIPSPNGPVQAIAPASIPGQAQFAINRPDSTAIGDTPGDDTSPAVDFSGASYLVAWSYLLDTPPEFGILGRLVSPAGSNLSDRFCQSA